MHPPPDPETRSPTAANGRANRNLEGIQHAENTSTGWEEQYLRRLYALIVETAYTVSHISRGCEIKFRSRSICDEDQANAAALVLAEFTGAAVRR